MASKIFLLIKGLPQQREIGDEVKLVKKFIDYYYYKREYVQDTYDRFIIVVKYGSDLLRLQCNGDEFEKWYNSKLE